MMDKNVTKVNKLPLINKLSGETFKNQAVTDNHYNVLAYNSSVLNLKTEDNINYNKNQSKVSREDTHNYHIMNTDHNDSNHDYPSLKTSSNRVPADFESLSPVKNTSNNFTRKISFFNQNNHDEMHQTAPAEHVISFLPPKKLKDDAETVFDFLKKVDEEHNILMWQNLNMTKKKFNFNALNPTKENESKVENSKLILLKLNNKEKDPISKFIQMLNSNSINPAQDRMFSYDFYRSLIKEKMISENHLRRDLMSLSKLVLESKSKKEKLNTEKSESMQRLRKIKEEFSTNKMNYEKELKKIENFIKDMSTTNNFSLNRKYSQNFANDSEFKLKTNLIKLKIYKENEFKKATDDFEEEITKFKNEIINYENKIIQISKIAKTVNQKFKTKMEEAKQYYIEILKNGIDVRLDGLTWCIKKLLEMNCYLDYSHFPRFLENSQIDYLVKLSQKQVEIYYLNLVLRAIKVQKNMLKLDFANQFTYNIKNSGDESNVHAFFFPPDYKSHFSEKTVLILEKVLSIFQNMVNEGTLERTSEDHQTQMIVSYLKDKILFQTDPKEFEAKEMSPLIKSLERNLKSKDRLEVILLLRQVMNDDQEEIRNLRKQEIMKFQKKFENNKLLTTKQNVLYDLTRAALFGNGISL